MDVIFYSYDPIHILCKSNINDLHQLFMKIFIDYGINIYGFHTESNTYWAKKEKNKKCLLYFTLTIKKCEKNNELILNPIINKTREIEKIYKKIVNYIYIYEVVPSLYYEK